MALASPPPSHIVWRPQRPPVRSSSQSRVASRRVPEAPAAGELRKVKIAYRCDICGTEVRMTVAPDQEPEAPRHCQDDMTLVTPVE